MGELADLGPKKWPTGVCNHLLICSHVLGCANASVACFVRMRDDVFL